MKGKDCTFNFTSKRWGCVWSLGYPGFFRGGFLVWGMRYCGNQDWNIQEMPWPLLPKVSCWSHPLRDASPPTHPENRIGPWDSFAPCEPWLGLKIKESPPNPPPNGVSKSCEGTKNPNKGTKTVVLPKISCTAHFTWKSVPGKGEMNWLEANPHFSASSRSNRLSLTQLTSPLKKVAKNWTWIIAKLTLPFFCDLPNWCFFSNQP